MTAVKQEFTIWDGFKRLSSHQNHTLKTFVIFVSVRKGKDEKKRENENEIKKRSLVFSNCHIHHIITFYFYTNKKPLNHHDQGLLQWRLAESNCGHTDFQSVALPSELKRRFGRVQFTKFCLKVKGK